LIAWPPYELLLELLSDAPKQNEPFCLGMSLLKVSGAYFSAGYLRSDREDGHTAAVAIIKPVLRTPGVGKNINQQIRNFFGHMMIGSRVGCGSNPCSSTSYGRIECSWPSK
jgi:hypothetical protein